MSINIVRQYICLTEDTIQEYLKLVFEKKYIKKYCDLFTEKYINIRYFNFYEYDVNATMREKIIKYLKKSAEEMIIDNIDDRKIIEQMTMFYYYVLYFDDVIRYRDIDSLIKRISKLRKRVLEKESDDFEKNLFKIITEYKSKKEKLLSIFESNEFYIKISNYKNKINVYRVNLDYNIKFPIEYSSYAVKKAFTTGIVDEDRLTIEYYLTVIKVLKDVLRQNFEKQYIVEFAITLLEKSKKLKALLKTIEEPVLQDKISLKIRYEDFIQNKEAIYEIMREGYNFTVILDKTFDLNYKNLEKLKIFKYIIVNRDLPYCDEIVGENVIYI